MICRIAHIQCKEIIDIASGVRYGLVSDVELDLDRGAVEALVIRGRARLWGLLGREPDIVIPWSCVRRVGEDIILVDAASLEKDARREGANFFLSNW